MKISIAQTKYRALNFDQCISDFELNYSNAAMNKADILVFPSFFIGGDKDVVVSRRPEYSQKIYECIEFIKKKVDENICVVFGHVVYNEGKFVNAISVINNNKIILTTLEFNLPVLFDYKGSNFAILNFEDDLLFENKKPDFNHNLVNIQYLIVLSKSFFTKEKNNLRIKFFEQLAIEYNIEIAYINFYGAEDSIIFDGFSFFINGSGKIKQAKGFDVDLIFNEGFQDLKFDTDFVIYDKIFSAISFALREYISLSGFSKVHLGISGGIDSAFVAYLACFALGSEKVVGISMPSKFSSTNSILDAKELSKRLRFKLIEMPINNVFEKSVDFLGSYFNTKGITEENLQARLRGLFLMSYSNSRTSLLLNTGNKSEIAVGYCTLYGDTCGGISLIGDLFKTEIYKLAKYVNLKSGQSVIPNNILLKEPSAELSMNQKDSDVLPEYNVLDDILKRYLINNEPLNLIYSHFKKSVVDKVLRLYFLSEYKRRQGPIIVKVSQKTFGSEVSIPILNDIYSR